MEVSIIIPAHNQEHYIGRSVRSALAQKFDKDKYEVIVINDGSTDKTEKILKSFKDQIKIITFKKNKGLSCARNTGIRESLGRYIICLDADDYISNDLVYIERLFLMNNHNIDAVSCDYYIVDNSENIIERRDAAKIPIACGIMFYKDKLMDIGLYDEKFLVMEDMDLRKRYLEKFNIYNIPLPLYRYRDHDRNITKKLDHIKHYLGKLHKKHKIKDMENHLRTSKNLKELLKKC